MFLLREKLISTDVPITGSFANKDCCVDKNKTKKLPEALAGLSLISHHRYISILVELKDGQTINKI